MKTKLFLFIQRFISLVCACAIAVLSIIYIVSVPVYAASSDWDALGEDAIALRDAYISYLKSWTSGDLAQAISSGWEIPSSWFKTLSDGVQCISPVDDWYYFLTEEDKSGGGPGHVRSGGHSSHSSDRPADEVSPVLPSESFQEIITQVNSFYSPSGDLDRLSWKNDPRWSELEKDSTKLTYRDLRITLMRNYKFNDKWYCIYLLPYYFDGTSYYYGTDLLYLYFESDVVGEAALYYKIYDTVTGNVTDPVKLADCFTSFYADIGPYFTGLNGGYWVNGSYILLRHATDSESFNTSNMTSHYASSGSTYGTCSLQSGFTDFWKMLKSDDGVTSINFANGTSYSQYFYQVLSTSTEKDYGFVCSDTFFFPELGGYTDIDPEKIPSNTTVTITGDTIGDYIYYDNKTGDTSTINEYITNNYTYITNNGSGTGESTGGGSGSSSGDVNVGGNVNVSGNVSVGGQIGINTNPIDINVNVSGVGSGGAGSSEASGVQFDEDVSLNNYYDWMNEQTSGFSGFMSQFFSWLPPEIVIMLCAGFACVILMRFLGR